MTFFHLCKETYRTTQLAVPLITSLIIQLVIEIINTIMLGKLGKDELAAGSLGLAILFFLIVIGIGLCSAIGILIARHFGGDEYDNIKVILNQSIYFMGLFILPCLIVLWNLPSFLTWMGQEPAIVKLTSQFLHALMWGVPPLLMYFVLREFVSALSHTKIIMLLSLIMAPFTALGNYILIYGKWGFPELGIAGIGYSTSLMQWLLLLIMIMFIYKNKLLNKYFITFPLQSIKWPIWKEIIRIGWPVSITMGLEVGLFSITTLMMGYFGADALAAHQIALQCASFIFMFPLGISQATAIRVSQGLGQKSIQNAKLAGLSGLMSGAIFAIITALLFLKFTTFWISLFIDMSQANHNVLIKLAINFLHVFVFFQIFDALQVIMNGALRGLKDTFIPMWLGLLSYWIIGVTSGYYFAFILHWNGTGLWWGLAAGISVSGIVLLARFLIKIKQLEIHARTV